MSKRLRIFLAIAIVFNLASVAAFIYCLAHLTKHPDPGPYLDTWEYHADKPARRGLTPPTH